MAKVLILKGLPASGKSTYAKDLVEKGWKRVNKDDLRAMIDSSHWSSSNEKHIIRMRNYITLYYLGNGFNIVVDDTNLNPKHEKDIREMIIKNPNPEVARAEVDNMFFDVTIKECIERDLKRPASVGKDVIMRMYNQWLKPKPELYTPPEGKPDCFMIDIDGTLAHMNGRSPFEWKRVGEDDVDPELPNILSQLVSKNHMDEEKTYIILLSGRDSVCRPETEKWLADHGIQYDHLYMRPEKDSRKDFEVKLELFNNHVRDNYRVRVVFDDRDQVVSLWRSLGLKCYQVAEGDF